METLFFFAMWVGFIWLARRRGYDAHIIEQQDGRLQNLNGPDNRDNLEILWIPPAKDVDPACGNTVTTDKAKSSVYRGRVYYFCSRECREVFEAAPDLYVGNGDSDLKNGNDPMPETATAIQ